MRFSRSIGLVGIGRGIRGLLSDGVTEEHGAQNKNERETDWFAL
jgi:hypothetical protein